LYVSETKEIKHYHYHRQQQQEIRVKETAV